MKRHALALVVLLGGSQLCFAGLFSDDEANKKIGELQQKAQSLEDRIGKLENVTRSQGLLDLLSQVEAMKADMSKLRGQLEVQTHDIDITQKRQKDLYVDMDSRLRKLERVGGPAAAGDSPAAATTSTSTPAQPVVAAADPAAASSAYEIAFNLFKIGNYQAAIAAFQNFIKNSSASPLAPSAQYWVGNSYYSLRDYKAAIANQQKLISQYPGSQKIPDAMLNIASCQFELGEKDAARKTLEDLVVKYPVSQAADAAKKRLANLK